jgi:hypothetical protein
LKVVIGVGEMLVIPDLKAGIPKVPKSVVSVIACGALFCNNF